MALAIQRAYGPIYARIDSWSQVPFVDVTVIDAAENPTGCPASHPDELIFEIWPGTMGLCDYLENEHDRSYELGKPCDKAGDVDDSKYQKQGDDAYSVWGINPSIQNVVKGARYCGKRGGETLTNMTRPQYIASEDKYKCKDGWSPCNGNVAID